MKVDFKNLKNVDWKKLLLEKGEMIGLGVAGVLTLVLLVYGLGFKTFGSGSASANAQEIEDLAKQANQKIDGNQPQPTLAQPDQKVIRASTPNPIDPVAQATQRDWFIVSSFDDNRWRKPEMLSPGDFEAGVFQGLVQVFELSDDGSQIWVLVRRDNKPNTKQQEELMRQLQSRGKRGRNARPTTPTTPAVSTFPQGRPGMGAMGGPGGMMRPGTTGMGGDRGSGKEELEAKQVAVSSLGDEKGIEIMQNPEPRRIAIVTGAFPYRAQLEAFRQALRFPSVAQMLRSDDANIEFLDLEVQRRTVADGKAGDWQPLDLASMKRLMVRAVDKVKDDPQLHGQAYPVSPTRLMMVRPKLAAAHDQKYPELMPASVRDTLEKLNEVKEKSAPVQRKPSRFEQDPDLFDQGGDKPGPATGGPGGFQGAMPPRDPDHGPTPGPGGPGGPQGTLDNQEVALPDTCLVRFLDVSIQPGKVYQYRVRVKMTNPNYGMKDRALSMDLTVDKELAGPWKEIGKDISIPPDLFYYAVDEERAEGQRGYEKTNADRVAVQVHRWMDTVFFNNRLWAVGDWVILKRALVYRGEMLNVSENVEVPAWVPTLKEFLFLKPTNERTPRGTVARKGKGIPVEFNTDAMLVDFEGGGQRSVTVGGRTVTDTAPAELLILGSDGRMMVARNGAKDTADTARADRLKSLEKWLGDVQKNVDEAGGTKKPGGENLFDPVRNR